MAFKPEQSVIAKIQELISVDVKEAELILSKSALGGEMNEMSQDEWFAHRFEPNTVFLSDDDYAKMCVDALKIVPTVAHTDMGASRQRDLAQVWADMTRGYLGEQAFVNFLSEKHGIRAGLAHERGETTDEFLSLDINQIEKGGVVREPRLRLGVKTTKWNGIWFDIPYAEFGHSDVHALVKVGVFKDHLMAFLKSLSVMRDKVLPRGVRVGALTEQQSADLYEELPTFKKIPSYICGFVNVKEHVGSHTFSGVLKKKNYTVTEWAGEYNKLFLDSIKRKESVPGTVRLESIGELSHDKGYLFNTGNLKWSKSDWEKMIGDL
jgi:hypothetical protein